MKSIAQKFWQTSVLLAVFAVAASSAHAVPSFSRQTGQDCAACHVGGFGPQLTPFGIAFKLGGYTLSDGKDGHVPLSAMLVGSWSQTHKDQAEDAGPYDGTNNNSSLQQVSAFIAGAISEHLGTFMQGTYSDIDKKTVMDNADVRYARPLQFGDTYTVSGISINNNPSAQDPFNTTPAWRYPYIASELVPAPAAATLIEGGLGQQVLGVTAYTLVNNAVYLELGGYRSLSRSALEKLNVGDDAGELTALAPYWRAAYFKNLGDAAYALGVFGLNAKLQPGRQSGPSDKYADIGIDGMYQYLGNRANVVAFNGSYIHERRDLNASFANGDAADNSGSLDSLNLNVSYNYMQHYGLTLGYFDISGNRDAGLYAYGDPDAGSLNNKPDSAGEIIQADWTPFGTADSWGAPWHNLRLGVQYTLYSKFNGASHNYDGFGRSASDNDTLYLFAWFAI